MQRAASSVWTSDARIELSACNWPLTSTQAPRTTVPCSVSISVLAVTWVTRWLTDQSPVRPDLGRPSMVPKNLGSSGCSAPDWQESASPEAWTLVAATEPSAAIIPLTSTQLPITTMPSISSSVVADTRTVRPLTNQSPNKELPGGSFCTTPENSISSSSF